MKNDLADDEIVRLAADCGILARGQKLKDVRDAHNLGKCPVYQDQFDMQLDEALKRRGS